MSDTYLNQWWEHKHKDETERLQAEIDGMRLRIQEMQDSFFIISAMRAHLTNSKGQLHSVLNHFSSELNIIFDVSDKAQGK